MATMQTNKNGMAEAAERAVSDDVRWRAALARETAADSLFVYGVRSTGIYCRPSCPSRKPARRQVEFFDAPEAAEGAGYRPCRRCDPKRGAASDPRLRVVRDACRFIDAHLDDRLSLAAVAREAGASPHRLLRAFKQVTGISPREYADALRLETFKGRLRDGGSVTHAMYDAGYGSSSRVYERAQERLGMTPGTYRRGGPGVQIRYATAESALGRLLVAGTPRGVCAVYLGESDAPLEAALRKEYPAAEIRRDEAGIRPWIAAILRHLEGRQPRLDLPTDVRATAFQQRVWRELRRIPYGETRTYREIASRIGAPLAARAVGRACATNPVSVLVPCHRAVRGDGASGGYRWGADRKERLLAHERRMRGKEGDAAV